MVSIIDKKQQGFNTQPPEGGCATMGRAKTLFQTFQHTAARRRLQLLQYRQMTVQVSTHSRPKAAEPLLKALFHQVSQPRFR